MLWLFPDIERFREDTTGAIPADQTYERPEHGYREQENTVLTREDLPSKSYMLSEHLLSSLSDD